MASRAFLKRLKRCSRSRRCNCVRAQGALQFELRWLEVTQGCSVRSAHHLYGRDHRRNRNALGIIRGETGADYPFIVQSWQRNWPRIGPHFDYPAEIRKVIYTTNAIESVNMSLRRVTQKRGSFPNGEALIKLYYLALRNISKKWTMPIQNWKAALNRFTIMFDERMPQH